MNSKWLGVFGLLTIASLSSCSSSNSNNDILDKSQLYAYRSTSEFAPVLKNCALAEVIVDTCTLETLPFIAQANPDFTRSDILDRLLVTHDWMGQRFEALLNDAPDKMIPLFGSLTAITIGSTVRPSFYWAGTGSIQLDPEGLWLSVEEKANVSAEEDYRSGFGDGLQFWFFETLRDGNQPAVTFYRLDDDSERPYEDIKIPMYRLLYHELAHAIDYLPAESIPSLDASLNPAEALTVNGSYFLSPQLSQEIPLNSEVLYELGQVSFRGNEATDDQKSYESEFLGAEMASDGGARYYAYSTIREDFATLFAVSMMKYDFDLDTYTAFVNKPADLNNYYCDELLVGWGQKNRLADTLVEARARWVLERVLGQSTQVDDFFSNNAKQFAMMDAGVDWCTNRDAGLLADAAPSTRSKTVLTQEQKETVMRQLEFERRVRIH